MVFGAIGKLIQSPLAKAAASFVPGASAAMNFASAMGAGGKASDLAGTVAAGGGVDGAANSILSVGRDTEGLGASNSTMQANTLARSREQNALSDLNNQLQLTNDELENGRKEQQSHSNQNSTIQQIVHAKAESALQAALQQAQRG